MPLVPDRLWEEMTPEEQANVEEIVDGWRQDPCATCPNCGVSLRSKVKLTWQVVRLAEPDGALATPIPAESVSAKGPRGAAPEELVLLKGAREAGMLDAFVRTLNARPNQPVPKNIEQAFLSFFKVKVEKPVPRPIVERYKIEFPDTFLRFWIANGVIAVEADRQVRAFFPQVHAFGQRINDVRGIQRTALGVPEAEVERWIKGRFGYVPANSLFADEFKKRRSFGDFDTVPQ